MSDTLREIMDEYDDADAPEGFSAELVRFAGDIETADEVGADASAMTAMRERFALTEPEHFDWAARKLARAQAEKKRYEAWLADERYKLEQAFGRRIASAERDIEFFDGMIRFAVENLEPDAKGKRAIKTPHLTACVTVTKHYEWPADEALIEWARAQGHAEFVRVKESPDKVAIKAHVKETGETPDGLEVTDLASVRMDVSA